MNSNNIVTDIRFSEPHMVHGEGDKTSEDKFSSSAQEMKSNVQFSKGNAHQDSQEFQMTGITNALRSNTETQGIDQRPEQSQVSSLDEVVLETKSSAEEFLENRLSSTQGLNKLKSVQLKPNNYQEEKTLIAELKPDKLDLYRMDGEKTSEDKITLHDKIKEPKVSPSEGSFNQQFQEASHHFPSSSMKLINVAVQFVETILPVPRKEKAKTPVHFYVYCPFEAKSVHLFRLKCNGVKDPQIVEMQSLTNSIFYATLDMAAKKAIYNYHFTDQSGYLFVSHQNIRKTEACRVYFDTPTGLAPPPYPSYQKIITFKYEVKPQMIYFQHFVSQGRLDLILYLKKFYKECRFNWQDDLSTYIEKTKLSFDDASLICRLVAHEKEILNPKYKEILIDCLCKEDNIPKLLNFREQSESWSQFEDGMYLLCHSFSIKSLILLNFPTIFERYRKKLLVTKTLDGTMRDFIDMRYKIDFASLDMGIRESLLCKLLEKAKNYEEYLALHQIIGVTSIHPVKFGSFLNDYAIDFSNLISSLNNKFDLPLENDLYLEIVKTVFNAVVKANRLSFYINEYKQYVEKYGGNVTSFALLETIPKLNPDQVGDFFQKLIIAYSTSKNCKKDHRFSSVFCTWISDQLQKQPTPTQVFKTANDLYILVKDCKLPETPKLCQEIQAHIDFQVKMIIKKNFPEKQTLKELGSALLIATQSQITTIIETLAKDALVESCISDQEILYVSGHLFPQGNIVNEKAKAIVHYYFGLLEKQYPDPSLREIMSSDVIYKCVVRCEGYEEHAYTREIKSKVRSFAEKFEKKEVTIEEADNYLNNEPKFFKVMLKEFGYEHIEAHVQEIRNIVSVFKKKLYRIDSLLENAMRLNIVEENYTELLKQKHASKHKLTIQQILNDEFLTEFNEFNSLPQQQYFREVPLFKNILNCIKSAPPESLAEFDEFIVEKVSQACVNHLKKLQYHGARDNTDLLLFGELHQYWMDATKDDVRDWLNEMEKYSTEILNEKTPTFSKQLVEDLEDFIELDKWQKILNLLIKTKDLFEFIEIDDFYNAVKDFLKFRSNLKDEDSLEYIVTEMNKLKQFKEIFNVEETEMEFFDKLVKAKETFTFLEENENLDLRVLHECIDERSTITVKTLSDLKDLKAKFPPLRQKVELEGTFLKSIICLKNEFERISREDFSFIEKLRVCGERISEIKSKIDSHLKMTEYTANTIKTIINTGRYHWRIVNDQQNECELFAKVDETQDYENAKLNELSTRALLLNASEVVEDYSISETSLKREATIFYEQVKCAQDLMDIYAKLHTSGHPEYRMVEFKVSNQMGAELCTQQIQEMSQRLQPVFEDWKSFLIEVRRKYRSLCYISNRKLCIILDALTEGNKYSDEFLNILKFINRNAQLEELNLHQFSKEINYHDKLEKIGQILDNILIQQNAQVERNVVNASRYQEIIKIGTPSVLKVNTDVELIDALVSLYASHGGYPEASQILFCTPTTEAQDIEIFLMRCYHAEKDQNNKQIYAIANFHNLPYKVQLEVKEMLDKRELRIYPENNSYYLCILYVASVAGSHIIEEYVNIPIFSRFIPKKQRTEYVQDKRNNIQVFTSETAGLGKSRTIIKIIEQSKKKHMHIPIYGDLNRGKIINLMKERLDKENLESCAIHFDLYPTAKESLNIILFELLFFGILDDISREMFLLPYDVPTYIEVSNTLSNSLRVQLGFLDYFYEKNLSWNADDTEISLDPQSDMQVVCTFLRAMDDGKTLLRLDSIITNAPIIQEKECKGLLDKHYFSHLKGKLSFYHFYAFLRFLSDQLRHFDQCFYLKIQELRTAGISDLGIRQRFIQDFVSIAREISYQTVSIESQTRALRKLDEEEVALESMKINTWEQNTALFIAFSDDHAIIPIYKERKDIPKSLADYYNMYGKQLIDYNDEKQEVLVQKLCDLCSKNPELTFKNIKESGELDKIAISRDNFLKMALIYLRVRAGIPAIIMGETGVGKTAIIKLLSKAMDALYGGLNVHAGTTEQDIVTFVRSQERLLLQKEDQEKIRHGDYESKSNPQTEDDKRIVGEMVLQVKKEQGIETRLFGIIFFDEINASEHVKGILKEIMLDHTLYGKPIMSNLIPIAACNPYKKKEGQELVTAGLRMENLKTSKLVYLVHPLPESMLYYVWDYGVLTQHEERFYIRKILERDTKRLMVNYTSDLIDIMTKLVLESHKFVREAEAPWAVSLRDVARCSELNIFFFNYGQGSIYERSLTKTKKHAMILALAFCYHSRFGNSNQRAAYRDMITQISKQQKTAFTLDEGEFDRILSEKYDDMIGSMKIPKGIAKNLPLKENIFTLFVCILNKLPVILTGAPGSSKTLAVSLVDQTLKGQSSSFLFGKLPIMMKISYQASIQSTSEGFEKVFQRATELQNQYDKNQDNSKVVVIIDEIGLAELSPYNPLKVLHSLLEPPQFAVIGISNWSLDAAKMNRTIHISRPEPTENDLIETARAVKTEYDRIEKFSRYYLNGLAKGYFTYYDSKKPIKYFHGLRDYYYLTSFVCKALQKGEMINEQSDHETIVLGLQRNLGGQNFSTVLDIFSKFFGNYSLKKVPLVPSKDLIADNLEDKESRHLMVLTDNFESSINFVEEVAKKKGKKYRVFYGSDFPGDQKDEVIYNLIKEVILCMETGVLCVLLNLENLYQSFYDMLNQNYQIIDGRKYCRVAIGPDSSRCHVHDNFKCVLIMSNKIDRLKNVDPPLLNRFEKQEFSQNMMLDRFDKQILGRLKKWIKDISNTKGFTEKDMFPVYNEAQLSSLIFVENESRDEEEVFRKCQESLIWTATYYGIQRSKLSKSDDSTFWYDRYMHKQQHDSLTSFLTYAYEEWQAQKTNKAYLNNWIESFGFNILVYTTSPFEDQILKEIPQELRKLQNMHLSAINSEQEFRSKVKGFYSDQRDTFLLVHADEMLDSRERVILTLSIMKNMREEYKQSRAQTGDKHICFIMRTKEIYYEGFSFSKDCKHATIDILYSPISINYLLSEGEDKFDNKDLLNNLYMHALAQAISKIGYQQNDLWKKERIETIRQLLESHYDFKDIITNLAIATAKRKSMLRDDNWQTQVACDSTMTHLCMTLQKGLLAYLNKVFSNALYVIFYVLESQNLINILLKKESKELKKYLMSIIGQKLEGEVQKIDYEFEPNLKLPFQENEYPFSQDIHSHFMRLENRFMGFLNMDDNNEEDEQFTERNALALDEFQTLMLEIETIDLKISEAYKVGIQEYLHDFSHFLHDDLGQEYSVFLKWILKEFYVKDFTSIDQIYATYWPRKALIMELFNFINVNSDMTPFCKVFKESQQLKENEAAIDKDSLFLPKESILTNISKIYVAQFIPTESLLADLISKQISWEMKGKAVLVSLRKMMFENNVAAIPEIRIIEYLTDFITEVCTPLSINGNTLVVTLNEIFQKVGYDNALTSTQTVEYLEEFIGEIKKANPNLDKKLADNVFLKLVQKILVQVLSAAVDENGVIEFTVQFIARRIIERDDLSNEDLSLLSQLGRLIVGSFPDGQDLLRTLTDFPSTLTEFESLKSLNNTLEILQLPVDHPVHVILNDSIEILCFIKSGLDQELSILNKNFEYAMTVIKEPSSILQKLIAISFFRVYARILSGSIHARIINDEKWDKLSKNDQELYEEMRMKLNKEFNEAQQENLKILSPFMLYLLKLIVDDIGILQLKNKAIIYLPWIDEKVSFPKPKVDQQIDQEIDQRFTPWSSSLKIQEACKQYDQSIGREQDLFGTGLFAAKEIDETLAYSLAILRNCYCKTMVCKPNEEEEQYKILLKMKSSEMKMNSSVLSFYIRNEIGPDWLKPHPNRDINEHCLLSFLGYFVMHLALDGQSLFHKIFRDPSYIQGKYLPFCACSKDLMIFKESTKQGNGFVRTGLYKCKGCGFLFGIGNCTKPASTTSCPNCKNQIGGINHNPTEHTSLIGIIENGDIESIGIFESGYVNLSPEQLGPTDTCRKIESVCFRIGHLLLHSTLLLSSMFSGVNREELKSCLKVQESTQIMPFLKEHIENDWAVLMNTNQITPENLLVVLYRCVDKIWSQRHEDKRINQIQLTNKDERKKWEDMFAEEIVPKTSGYFQAAILEYRQVNSLINNKNAVSEEDKEDISNEQHCTEGFDVPNQEFKNKYMLSLLRISSKPTIEELYRRVETEGDEYMFLRTWLKNKEQIEKLSHLKPLAEFLSIVKTRFSGRVTRNYAYDTSIMEVINQEVDKEELSDKLYLFLEAWNAFAGQELPFECDHLIITKLTDASKFEYLCWTDHDDKLGLECYLLIRYLLDIQNTFLRSLLDNSKLRWMLDIIKGDRHKVSFFNIEEKHIIKYNDDRLKNQMYERGFSSIKHGQGKEVYFDLGDIQKQVASFNLGGKYLLNEKIDPFKYKAEYVPVSILSDLSETFPQEVLMDLEDVIHNTYLRSDQDVNDLFGDLITTLYFLKETKSEPTRPLAHYMKEFIKSLAFQGNLPGSIQLKHAIHFYEILESRIADELIKKVFPKYMQKIESSHEAELKGLTFVPSQILLRTLGRLLIRHLTENRALNEDLGLFEFLTIDDNIGLWGVGNEKYFNISKEVGLDLTVKLKHSYQIYLYLSEKLKKEAEDEKRKAWEKEQMHQENMKKMQTEESVEVSNFNNLIQKKVNLVKKDEIKKPATKPTKKGVYF